MPETAKTIKSKLNSNVRYALEVMQTCLEDKELSSDKRYKIASDYLSLYFRMDSEVRKEEEHRINMRYKRVQHLKAEYDLENLQKPISGDEEKPKNSFSPEYMEA